MKTLRIIFICFTLISIAGNLSYAQSKKIAKADTLFKYGAYSEAIDKYKAVYSKVKSNDLKAEICYKMGECYFILNDNRKAESYYKKALRYNYKNPDAALKYAFILKKQGDYDEALLAYESYKELVPDDPAGDIGIKSCKKAKEWQKEASRYEVKEMDDFNDRKASCYAPAFVKSDYTELIFTSSQNGTAGNKKSNVSGQNYADIFIVELDRKGKWSEAVPIPGEVNTEYDEGTPCLNKNRIIMYYTGCPQQKNSNLNCKVYTARYKSGIWTDVEQLNIVGDSSVMVAHPAISDDEKTLYFVSDMKGGQGGKDLWLVKRNSKTSDKWGKPVNLGTDINTPGDEMFPCLRKDNELYFSSNYHLGMGGLDIFKAVRDDNGKWTVENMKPPVNSNFDDFGIVFEEEGEKGYFSSNRSGREEYDGLFSFVRPEMEFSLKGVVRDEKTKNAIEGAIIKITASDGSVTERTSASNGAFRMELTPKTDYILISEKKDYLKGKATETTKGLKESKELSVIITMVPVEKDKGITLPNIEYDVGKATLRPESMVSLDGLVETLTENDNLTIELGAHTDYRGSDESNQDLAQRRAQSVVDYLIKKGIAEDRLVAKGYGESQPKVITEEINKKYSYLPLGTALTETFILTLDETQQEIANQINRRTEFKILSTTYKK